MAPDRRAHHRGSRRRSSRAEDTPPSRSRRAPAWLPLPLLLAYGLGALLVPVPLGGDGPRPPTAPALDRPIAAVVAGPGAGYVLDRDGSVLRVGGDGSYRWTATAGPYAAPFGTSVGSRVVVGGVRCDGSECDERIAEVTVLGRDGQVASSVELHRAARDRPGLDGAALVGTGRDHLWVNAGGALHRVEVDPGRVVDRVPWPGGEPCLLDGTLHDLAAAGPSYRHQGAVPSPAGRFDLVLRAWDGTAWRSVAGGATSMAAGRNAHCTPDGYAIREGDRAVRRWRPATGWRTLPRPTAGAATYSGRSQGIRSTTAPAAGTGDGVGAAVTTSRHTRYTVARDGAVLDATGAGPAAWTGVTIPGLAGSRIPPAVQVDETAGWLFWCATSYRAERTTTRCSPAALRTGARTGPAPDDPGRTRPGHPPEPVAVRRARTGGMTSTGRSRTDPGPTSSRVHHYNLCSAACGGGVRPHTRDVVAWFGARHRPVALSLNELCYDDTVHLGARLAPELAAGTRYVALGTATACPGAVKQFGNQVRVRPGWTSSWWAQFPTQAAPDCDHRDRECRGVACAAAGLGPGRTVFCSAHLESARHGPAVARAQAGEYLDLVSARYPAASTRTLAGDFNLSPDDADAELMPGGYHAGAPGPTVGGHDPPASGRIDMIYHGGPGAATGSPGTAHCDAQASDHCYLMRDLGGVAPA